MNKDIASVFEWFAQESKSIAEQANEPNRRERLADLALLWAIAASHRRAQEGFIERGKSPGFSCPHAPMSHTVRTGLHGLKPLFALRDRVGGAGLP